MSFCSEVGVKIFSMGILKENNFSVVSENRAFENQDMPFTETISACQGSNLAAK